MPSIAQMPVSSSTTSSAPGGKKRKRDQIAFGEGENYAKLSSMQYTSPPFPSRSPFTIESSDNTSITSPSQLSRLVLKPRSLKPARPHDAKRQRILVSEFGSQDLSTLEYDGYNAPKTQPHSGPTVCLNSARVTTNYTRTDLSSCHICHQKPKVRTDLDSYGDCEGCGKRTCYICMRECLGPASLVEGKWQREESESDICKDEMSFTTQLLRDEAPKLDDRAEGLSHNVGTVHKQDGSHVSWPNEERREWGHRGMICSQCCVERGADGEVRCLGCLRAEEGG